MNAAIHQLLPYLGIVIAIGVVLVLLRGLFSSSGSRLRPESYKPIDFMNTSEHAFLIALRRAAPAHIAVLAKVRVADIIATRSNNIPAFNRIARKHVDFVLYNLQTRKVLRAIELDGPTHQSERSRRGDNIKNISFASARVPLARVPVSLANNPETIRNLFADERDEQTLGALHASADGVSRPRANKGAEPQRAAVRQGPPSEHSS